MRALKCMVMRIGCMLFGHGPTAIVSQPPHPVRYRTCLLCEKTWRYDEPTSGEREDKLSPTADVPASNKELDLYPLGESAYVEDTIDG